MIQYYTESLSLGFLKLWEDEQHKVQIKNNFCRSITSVTLATITGSQGFWRLLFHDAQPCRSQILSDRCLTVSQVCVIQKIVVGDITQILCSQDTTCSIAASVKKSPAKF